MKTTAHNLRVCLVNNEVWFKVSGRANFSFSVDFRTLVQRLKERGYKTFVLDLTDCLLMDSTFLGVLAGLGLKFGGQGGNGKGEASIELLNPSNRIADLLENLGVNHLFGVRQGPPLVAENQLCVDEQVQEPSKTELTRACLEAHNTLMEVNPGNVPKFKDVAKFLAEDLRRLEEEGTNGKPGESEKPRV